MENKKEKNGPDEKQQNLTELVFVVNGKETTVEKVNFNQPLHVSAQKALEQTGNIARPLSDWLVKVNDVDMNLSAKVEDLNLGAGVKIIMSLKGGKGGNC